MLAGVVDLFQIIQHVIESLVLGLFRQQFAVADNGVQWGSKLVTHVGEEFTFRQVCISRLISSGFQLAGASRDKCGNLIRHAFKRQRDKAALLHFRLSCREFRIL